MFEKLFNKECVFKAGVQNITQLPAESLPEFAFAGRSNVGKSSLLNALLGRTKLVRTSKDPGRTRQLNFFQLADILYLVDMPGYGYAKVSKKERNSWQALITDYLCNRQTLKRIFLLLDARHPPKEYDLEFMNFLDHFAIPYQIVFTKCDANSSPTLLDLKRHPAAHPQIIQCSSKSKQGILDLQQAIISALTNR